GLLRRAVLKSNVSLQRGGDAPDDSSFDLLLDTDRIDDQPAIDRGHHAFHFDVAASVHRDIDNVGDVRPAIVSVAGHTATMSLHALFRPFGFIADCFENA